VASHQLHPIRRENPQADRPTVRDKALDVLIEAAWNAGWWCEMSKRGNVKCYPPDGGQIVFVENKAHDHRTADNTRSRFRRSGLNI